MQIVLSRGASATILGYSNERERLFSSALVELLHVQ